jgi:hypothetical protein
LQDVCANRVNKALVKYGGLIFVTFGIAGYTGVLLIDTPFNAPFRWAFVHLSAPIVVGVVVYVILYQHELVALTGSRTRVYGNAVLLAPVLPPQWGIR